MNSQAIQDNHTRNSQTPHTFNPQNSYTLNPSRTRNSSVKKSNTPDNQTNFFRQDYLYQPENSNTMTNSTNYTLKDAQGVSRTINRVDYNKYLPSDYKPPTIPINNYKEYSLTKSKSKNAYEISDINRRSISPMREIRSPQRLSTSYKSPIRELVSPRRQAWASPGQNSIKGSPQRLSIQRRSSIRHSQVGNSHIMETIPTETYVSSNKGETYIEKPIYIEKIVEKPVDKVVYIDRPVEKIVYKEKPVEKIVYVDKIVEKPVYISDDEEKTKLIIENRQLSEKILYNQELHSQNLKLVGQTNKKINELIKEKNILLSHNDEIKQKEDKASSENSR